MPVTFISLTKVSKTQTFVIVNCQADRLKWMKLISPLFISQIIFCVRQSFFWALADCQVPYAAFFFLPQLLVYLFFLKMCKTNFGSDIAASLYSNVLPREWSDELHLKSKKGYELWAQ